MTTDFFSDLRDEIIPEGNIKNFNRILNHYECELGTLDPYFFNQLLGAALYHYNLYIITSINSIVRELKIKTTRTGILEGVYHAYTREDSRKRKGTCVSYIDFSKPQIYDEIYGKYARFLWP